jgi:ubiquinone/menaquinone biosynthesis C-methylase UbiE
MRSRREDSVIDSRRVQQYFDEKAAAWSAGRHTDPALIRTVLKQLEIGTGSRVLDIACGTGVLFPFYLEQGARVTGVDLSEGMIAAARTEYPDNPQIALRCADACRLSFQREFDACVIFDSLPHFPDIPALLQAAAGYLKDGGRLCILFDHSRSWVNGHHAGLGAIARDLPALKELEAMLPKELETETAEEDRTHYLLCARRKTADAVLQ